MSTTDRVFAVLKLFSLKDPEWTVEQAASELGCPTSTMYRYFRSLVGAGLIVRFTGNRYVLGPAVIAMDRQTRNFDPLIKAATLPLENLVASVPLNCIALLCRSFQSKVICTFKAAAPNADVDRIYERGSLMPLLRGACSLSISSYLPTRTLKRFFDDKDSLEPSERNLDWDSLRSRMKDIRKNKLAITRGELVDGFVGIASPVYSDEGEVFASVGVVLDRPNLSPDAERVLAEEVLAVSAAVSKNLKLLG